MATYALKFCDPGGKAPHTGFAWPLPRGSRPGKWVKATGQLYVCLNGIHAVKLNEGALDWLRAECYVIELDGESYDEVERKYVARRGRLVRRVKGWDERAQRLFAYDCAKHVLPIYEAAFPGDTRVRECLAVSNHYANASASDEELEAAWEAARAAAGAAWAAAGAAAGEAAGAAAGAAWAAAGAAAGAAAWEAGGEAAWEAASPAARAAARAAGGAAAWAAGAAEQRWQLKRLARYIDAPEVD